MKVFLITLLCLAAPLRADVFKTVTPDGEVIYSDVRTKGAKEMNVPRPQTYTPPPMPVLVNPPVVKEEEKSVYSSFVIDSPVNEETIRDNLGNISMLLTLQPGLITRQGHRIEYYLDGEAHGRKTVDLEKTYVNVDRGEHVLSAAVVDEDGNVIISTAPVTVYLRRASSQQPFSPINPNNPNNQLGPGGQPLPPNPPPTPSL